MLRARISIETCDERLAEALAEALRVEASHPPDPSRGSTRVEKRGTKVEVYIEARDPPSARALINAYLTLAASLWDSVEGAEGVQEEGKG